MNTEQTSKNIFMLLTFFILDFDFPACLYRCSLGERFTCALWRKCTSFGIDLQLIPFVLSSSSFSTLSSSSCSSWRVRSWYICNLEKHQKISLYFYKQKFRIYQYKRIQGKLWRVWYTTTVSYNSLTISYNKNCR